MPLKPASSDFIQSIRDALVDAGMLRDQIVVLSPKYGAGTTYDPITDSGGPADYDVVIGPRAAYIKAEDSSVVTEAGLLQGIMRHRVQFIPKAGDPIMTTGMVVRVLEGGSTPALAQYVMSVLAAPAGSISALTKLECQTSGTPTAVWTQP